MTVDLNKVVATRFDDVAYGSPGGFAELELKPLAAPAAPAQGVRGDYFRARTRPRCSRGITVRDGIDDRVHAQGRRRPVRAGADVRRDRLELRQSQAARRALDPLLGRRRVQADARIVTLDATGVLQGHVQHGQPDAGRSRTDGTPGRCATTTPARGARTASSSSRATTSRTTSPAGSPTPCRARTRLDSGPPSDRLFDFDQTHILHGAGHVHAAAQLAVGGRFRFVTGNPTTPVVGSVFNAEHAIEYDPVYGKVNSARVAAFNQLDLRVDKRWVYQWWLLDSTWTCRTSTTAPTPRGSRLQLQLPQDGGAAGPADPAHPARW